VRSNTVVGVELVERWWNGQWGKMGRRDIWVWRDGETWRVRGRQRGEGGPEVNYMYTGLLAEPQARRMAQALREAPPANKDRWRDITDAVRASNERNPPSPPVDDGEQ
jgi:hypothetical protein